MKLMEYLRNLPHFWERWCQAEVLTLSMCKVSKVIVYRGKSPPTQFWSQVGCETREGRHLSDRSQNDGSGGAGPEKLVSLTWEKKRWVGRWTHPKCTKV